MAKKRNPQDTTLRNNRATDKRFDKLEATVAELQKRVKSLERWVYDGKKSQ